MSHDPVRPLFRSRLFTLGEFHCPPDHPRWGDVNEIGSHAHVVFPGTSVVIEQEGHHSLLANANHVVFYRCDQRYRRALHDPRGDHCIFVELEPALVAELLAAGGLSRADDLPFVQGPSEPRVWLAMRRAAGGLRRSGSSRLALEELVLGALRWSVLRGAAFHRRRRLPARSRTRADHQALVEDAKALLTERATGTDTLGALAAQLHVSEFHLARVFREHTGTTLHRYRTQLRLIEALERLGDDRERLATIAAETGFASHSHLARVFRSSLGVPPTRLRDLPKPFLPAGLAV
jgi:AraC-like DNA-binding protein